eukprot:673963-Pleurochrysis_carterae.AAC.1
MQTPEKFSTVASGSTSSGSRLSNLRCLGAGRVERRGGRVGGSVLGQDSWEASSACEHGISLGAAERPA